MGNLELLETLIPSVILALLIRLDSIFIGPYFSFSEIVRGMGGIEAKFWYPERRIRLGIVRRFLWPAVVGGLTAWAFPEQSLLRGAVLGIGAAGLLLWPMVFHGLPRGVAKNDWLLAPLYISVVIGFALGGFLGASIANFLGSEIEKVGLGDFLQQLLLPAVGLWVMRTLFSQSLARLEEKAQSWDQGND